MSKRHLIFQVAIDFWSGTTIQSKIIGKRLRETAPVGRGTLWSKFRVPIFNNYACLSILLKRHCTVILKLPSLLSKNLPSGFLYSPFVNQTDKRTDRLCWTLKLVQGQTKIQFWWKHFLSVSLPFRWCVCFLCPALGQPCAVTGTSMIRIC